ncbi:MAG: flagellar basal body L-ring protein FlgH, partial [Rhodobiaceae bacterium]|nr:flagellar basal body L-ring protein FlgH [Rhodobiaceae bacterium]
MTRQSVHAAARTGVVTLLAIAMAGCSAADRLKNVGEPPKLSAIEDPTMAAGYRPVSMPMPTPEPAVYQPNSLWRTGSRAFFRDQRARQVGDILTVVVKISDSAAIDNTTARSRKNSEDFGANGAVGNKLLDLLPSGTDSSAIVDINSGAGSSGSGSVDRKEKLTTTIAAVVTQVLPNGNLVIEGRQEIRVNFELRELKIAGVVRPEDID